MIGTIPLLAVAVALPVLLLFLRLRNRLAVDHLAAIAVFVIYLLGVASFTVFPLLVDAEYIAEMQQPGLSPLVALVPFFLGGDFMTGSQALGNVLLGIPFGLGLPFVWRTSIKMILVAGVLFSLVIEAIQFLINAVGVAFPRRSVDINDVLLNSVGAAIGVLAFAAIRLLYRWLFAGADDRVPPWSHVHRVLVGGRDRVATDGLHSVLG